LLEPTCATAGAVGSEGEEDLRFLVEMGAIPTTCGEGGNVRRRRFSARMARGDEEGVSCTSRSRGRFLVFVIRGVGLGVEVGLVGRTRRVDRLGLGDVGTAIV
jgi:hypothetical protein